MLSPDPAEKTTRAGVSSTKKKKGAPAPPLPKKRKLSVQEKIRRAQRSDLTVVPVLDHDGDMLGHLFSEPTTSLKTRSRAFTYLQNQKIAWRQLSLLHGTRGLKHAVPLPACKGLP